jgi:hypothetical protein
VEFHNDVGLARRQLLRRGRNRRISGRDCRLSGALPDPVGASGIIATPCAAFGNEGEWRFMVEKRRSFTDKLIGKNQMAENEGILAMLVRLIENEPDMKFLHIE